jgi:hypothetical protein
MSSKPKKQRYTDPPQNDRVLLIASDPSAPSEILASLAAHEDPLVRARVAANPNQPHPILTICGTSPHFMSSVIFLVMVLSII